MPYQELIKNFQNTRETMRSFFVYGLKTRRDFEGKSARTYDDERRRIESWLRDYMTYRQEPDGKRVFFSVDSRQIPHNPLYKAFQACSFTDRDITLHFYLMDLLDGEEEEEDGKGLTSTEITERMADRYLSQFPQEPMNLEESTVRKKLKEYEALGLVVSEKDGRQVRYRRPRDIGPDLKTWQDAVSLFSEVSPLGVVGSYLQHRMGNPAQPFRFKHHYILHALDSDILCTILAAMQGQQGLEITLHSISRGTELTITGVPLRVFCGIQGGRQHLLLMRTDTLKPMVVRVDAIFKAKEVPLPEGISQEQLQPVLEDITAHLWGVSLKAWPKTEHITFTVQILPGEEFVLQRLEREKRCGQVERLDPLSARFTADVLDTKEMLPWLRTFLGRISELECSNTAVRKTFWADVARMEELYGGPDHAVP